MRLAGDREIEVLDLEGDPDLRALVLLHEGLGSVGLWRGFPHALAEATGRRVVAFSRFGHGRSQPPAAPRTPAFFHEEALDVLPAVLDGLDAPEPILVGHSDGGSIALVHAAHRPVTAVVLVAPHVVVEEMTLAAIRRTREAYATDGLRERMARHHDDPRRRVLGLVRRLARSRVPAVDIEAEAGEVTAPLLLDPGRRRPLRHARQIDRIESRARGETQRLVVPGGHSPHLEHPDAVVARIAEFAAGLP